MLRLRKVIDNRIVEEEIKNIWITKFPENMFICEHHVHNENFLDFQILSERFKEVIPKEKIIFVEEKYEFTM